MDDLVLVDVLQTDQNVGHKELGFFFVEVPFIAQVVAQISAVEVVHDEIQVLSVLESVGHVH